MEGHSAVQPVWLWLDPTTRCNLSCRLCYTKASHGTADLQPHDLAHVLRSLRASPALEVKSIHLNWRGEPLMNPHFAQLLATVQDIMPDVALQWHTNGTMLTRRRVQEIMDVCFAHTIFVSIDGGDAASHDRNRGPGTFRKTMAGLRTLLEHPARTGLVKVGIYQINLGLPLECYDPEFVQLAGSVDKHLRVDPLLPGGTEHQIASIGSLESDAALERMMSEELNPHIPVPYGPCFWAGNVLSMAPNGDTSICLISHGFEGVMGNLLHEEPERVLRRARAFRAHLTLRGRQAMPHCAACRKPPGEVHEVGSSNPRDHPAAVSLEQASAL